MKIRRWSLAELFFCWLEIAFGSSIYERIPSVTHTVNVYSYTYAHVRILIYCIRILKLYTYPVLGKKTFGHERVKDGRVL